jgi:hypothetical protein
LSIDKEHTNFGLCSRCHDIAEDVVSGVDGAVEARLVSYWYFSRIVGSLLAEVELAASATAWVYGSDRYDASRLWLYTDHC